MTTNQTNGATSDLAADHDLMRANVLVCSETWAVAQDPDSHYQIVTHSMLRFDNRSHMFDDRQHRGMIVYYRECDISQVINYQDAGCDITGMQARTAIITLNVVGIYRSPQMQMAEFLLRLAQVISKLPPHNPLVIVGDFNVDISNFTPQTTLRLAYCDAEHHLRQLLTFMTTHSCRQLLAGPTADSGMQIDHVWTDVLARMPYLHPEPFRIEFPCSDHRAVGMHLGIAEEANSS